MIRNMRSEDLPQVAELEKICFSDPWSYDSLVQELENPLALYLVAVSGDTVVGYIGSWLVADELQIANLAVMPEMRRLGIGRRLMELLLSAVEKANGDGSFSSTLEVRESNAAAISLYESLGYKQVGRRRDYYHSPTEDALLMTRG